MDDFVEFEGVCSHPEPNPLFYSLSQELFADALEEECAIQGRDDLKIVYIPGMRFVALPRTEPNENTNANLTLQNREEAQNKSSAGSYPVSDDTIIRRFLVFGNCGTVYNPGTQKKLTMKNIAPLIAIIDKGKGFRILELLYDTSVNRRNPRQCTVLFALALCARYRFGELKGRHSKERWGTSAFSEFYTDYLHSLHSRSLKLLKDVCRESTDLFLFMRFYEMAAVIKGWGNGLREAFSEWYLNQSPVDIAKTVSTYGKREWGCHKEMFRLAHAAPHEGELRAPGRYCELEIIYKFVVNGKMENCWYHSKTLKLLEAVRKLNKRTPEDDVVAAISENGLLLEHIHFVHLYSTAVWEALLENMPLTTVINNLWKMQIVGLLDDLNVEIVCKKILDERAIKESRIPPLTILFAKHLYDRGCKGKGLKKRKTWTPNFDIQCALENALFASFINCKPTGKRFCYAFDVSDSTSRVINGSALSCRNAYILMGMVGVKTEEKCDVVTFSNGLTEVPFDKSWTLRQTEDHFNFFEKRRKNGKHKNRLSTSSSSIDCALPMLWALENKKEIDVFVIFTASEAKCGEVSPCVALQQYRESSGIKDARLVVVGMAGTRFKIADPLDAGMLDIAEFHATVPDVISHFATGNI